MSAPGPDEVVADANILIHSRAQFPFQKVFIPVSVMEEIKSETTKTKMLILDLEVKDPSKSSVEKVKDKSEDINSPTSEQDEEALALAIDTQKTLITDDKALQNLALHLDIDFNSFNTEKVDSKRSWKKVCSNCGFELSSPHCPRCGSLSWDRKRD